jgi:uncharacterized protein YjbI with pentapeptide repeats
MRPPDLIALARATVLLAGCVAMQPEASAQERIARVFDIMPGVHVSALPSRAFVDPSCGTLGGPRGMQIGSFARFQLCAPEPGGLREIWFSYDDAAEYAALARRAPNPRRTTTVLDQPVILSVLVDADGFVQGYRIFTDTRADHDLRLQAYQVGLHFKARFALDGHCEERPLAERETPIDGQFVKEFCRREAGGVRITSESRFYYRPGQQFFDPNSGAPMVNSFESSAQVEVVASPPQQRYQTVVQHQPLTITDDSASAFLAGATKDCAGCRLVEADLRYRDLSGANLNGANLEGALLHRANLARADLRGSRLDGANLNRATMANANLAAASLVNAMLYQTDLQHADLSRANLSRVLAGRVLLSFANLREANLDGGDFAASRATDADFSGASLRQSGFQQAVLARTRMQGIEALGANFAQARMRGADFRRASLVGADFSNADLVDTMLDHANLSDATMTAADLNGAKIDGVVFSRTRLPDNSLKSGSNPVPEK